MNVDYSSCTGCEACENICPENAIDMRKGKDGFLYPFMNKNKCMGCGSCVEVCQNFTLKLRQNRVKECYAALAPDNIREKSSSGGLFSIIANYILDTRGYVCGASFYEKTTVKHIIVDNKYELKKLRTSKYIQSRIGLIYRKIKELLKNGEKVLFSGTPCQVSGLYLYLGYNPENLYTIDILCHGVPSQDLFDNYLLEKYLKKKIIDINFRDKCDGWTYNLKLKVKTEDNIYVSDINNDPYYKSFNSRLSLRESCGACRFTSLDRIGDITLGDFWEIWTYDKTLDDRKGTSLVLLNSVKGEKLFQKIKLKLQKVKKVPLEYAMKGNMSLYRQIPLHKNRNQFFYDLNMCSLQEALEKNI